MTDDADGDVPTTSAEALAHRVEAGEELTVLDVRDRDEFETWHVDGESVDAVQVPHVKFVQAEVTGGVADLLDDPEEPIVVVCGEGDASAYVADLLVEAGFDAANLAGGMEAWARVYRTTEVPTGDGADDADAAAGGDALTVLQYRRPATGCLAYLVSDGDAAAVVDPLRAVTDRYVADCEERGWELVAALDTHVHADHVSGVRAVADRTGAEVVVPAAARERGLDYGDRDVRYVDHGDAVTVGEYDLAAVRLPGHTTEMTGYRVGDCLFAGDSLFLRAVARPDLEGAAEGEAGDAASADADTESPDAAVDDRARDLAATLYHTLRERVLGLPDATCVCPGHYEPGTTPEADGTYTATVGTLRDRVAALDLDRETFVDRVGGTAAPRPANFADIVATNLGRATTDDETAFELELGPNNCAASAD